MFVKVVVGVRKVRNKYQSFLFYGGIMSLGLEDRILFPCAVAFA
jgi:hypothetical protein